MEMFLALGRSSTLRIESQRPLLYQNVSDLHECIRDREDMRQMFIRDFGLIPGSNEEEWIHQRISDPNSSHLKKDLPFLIIQGTNDLRVSLNEGIHMVQKLEENGNPVDYLEIPMGNIVSAILLIGWS